jgi:ADP-heptose:LPS heptosyltransferase
MGRATYRMLTCGGIGDIILCTPALREMKRRDPGCHITVFARHPAHYAVLAQNPHIDRLRRFFWAGRISSWSRATATWPCRCTNTGT